MTPHLDLSVLAVNPEVFEFGDESFDILFDFNKHSVFLGWRVSGIPTDRCTSRCYVYCWSNANGAIVDETPSS
jgi:hypothetical protein